MKIHIGTDHAGFVLKNKLVEYLKTLGHDVVDHGAFSLDPNDDYPDFVKPEDGTGRKMMNGKNTQTKFGGNKYGPGNGTGNNGVGPKDGTGYGSGNGTGTCDGTGPKGNRGGRK